MRYFIYLILPLLYFGCANQNKTVKKESSQLKINNNYNSEKIIKPSNVRTETIIIGAGCFWCTESIYRALKGIITVESGYSGGKTENPTYREVALGNTGHAEVVKIEFNPEEILLEEVLLIFMATHNPTTLNRQGNDIGTEYRSVIFYNDENQKVVSEKLISELQPHYKDKIVTEISKLTTYFKAEDYHQNYYEKNPDQAYCNAVIPPKIEKLKKLFADKMK